MHIMKNTAPKNRIIELTEEMRRENMPELTEELFALFEKNGNRLEYENVYFARRKFLAVYGIASVLFKREEDLKKLEEVLKGICSEKTWALPAHCDTKKRPDTEKELDLFNSETAGALSEILKEVGDLIDPDLKEKVTEEISRRVLLPFTKEGSHFGFEHAHHNWNSVCCGSVGTVILNFGKEIIGQKETDSALNRINDSLMTFVKSFPKDGACLEGAGYFNYGISFLIAYARRFRKVMNKEPEFLKEPVLKKIAAFPNAAFFSCGIAVNFSDATEEEKLHAGTLQGLQETFGTEYYLDSKILADFETDPCYRFLPLLDDLRYAKDLKLNVRQNDKKISYLSEAQWVIAENGKACGFAIKGGHNDEPHNHNDVGNYIYLSDNCTTVCELGAGEYTADYFGQNRYNILCNSTEGHSLPLVDGIGQSAGKEYRADGFDVKEEKDKLDVTMDLSACYTNAKKVTRSAEFDLKTGCLTIKDEIDAEGRITDRIISKRNIRNSIELLSEAYNIETKTEIFRNHQGEEETVFIFEIKENEDGNSKEGTHGKGMHSIAYRLHP